MLVGGFGPGRYNKLRVSLLGLRRFGQILRINGFFGYGVDGLLCLGVVHDGVRDPAGGVLLKQLE